MLEYVYLLELHGDISAEQLDLPKNAGWKTEQFVSSLFSDKDDLESNSIHEIIRNC